MINYLQPLTLQEKATASISESISLVGISLPNTVTAVNGTVVKNGSDTGLVSTSVAEGDLIAIKVTSSSTFSTTVHAVLTIGTTKWIYQVTTKDDTFEYIDPIYEDVGPFDNLIVDPSYAINSDITVINSTTGAVIQQIELIPPIANTLPSRSYICVADHYKDRVIFLDKQDRTVLAKVDLPFGSLPTSCVAQEVDTTHEYAWVTASGINKLIKIDVLNLTILEQIDVDGRPKGLAVDTTNNLLWVTCADTNLVHKFDLTGNHLAQYQVGLSPIECCLDSTKNLWVACSKDNRIMVIDHTTGVVTIIPVGENPWDIQIIGTTAYVSNSFDGTLSRVSVTNLELIGWVYDVCSIPGDLMVDAQNHLWVAAFGERKVVKVVNNLVTASVDLPKTPVGVDIDNDGNLWVASMYVGHDRTFNYTYKPDRMSFLGVVNAELGTVYTSAPATVSGLKAGMSMPCSIPNIPGFVLLKNNVDVGQSTTITNGDQLKLRLTSDPGYYVTESLTMTYGQYASSFTVKTLASDLVVDQFTFDEQSDAALDTLFVSNTITISGATPGIPIPVELTNGTLVINAVDTGLMSSTIQNGDTLAIKMLSSTLADTCTTTRVSVGDIFEEWSILTSQVEVDHCGILPVVPDILGAELDVPVTTTFTISGIIDPEPLPEPPEGEPPNPPVVPNTALLMISGFPGNQLTFGGQTGQSFLVKNGDQVTITITSPKVTNTTMERTVYLNQHPLLFHVTTIADNQPDEFVFQDLMDVVPRGDYESNTVTISGLDIGVTGHLSVERGSILVGGIDRGAEADVVNGDQVQWLVHSDGPFGIGHTYTMMVGQLPVTITMYNIILNYAVRQFSLESNHIKSRALSAFVKERIPKTVAHSTQFAKTTRSDVDVATGIGYTYSYKNLVHIEGQIPVRSDYTDNYIEDILTAKIAETHAIAVVHDTTFIKEELSRVICGVNSTFILSEESKAVYKIPFIYHHEVRLTDREVERSFFPAEESKSVYKIPFVYAQYPLVKYSVPIGYEQPLLLQERLIDNEYVRYYPREPSLWATTGHHLGLQTYDFTFGQVQGPNLSNRVLSRQPVVQSIPSSKAIPKLAVTDTRITNAIIVTRTINLVAEKTNGTQIEVVREFTATRNSFHESEVERVFNAVRDFVHCSEAVDAKQAVAVPCVAHTATRVAVKEQAANKVDAGLGLVNIGRTKRFASVQDAINDGQNRWQFQNVQAIAWGDQTYVWTGNCSDYRPYPIAGYISGG